jgi:hypothetical protein
MPTIPNPISHRPSGHQLHLRVRVFSLPSISQIRSNNSGCTAPFLPLVAMRPCPSRVRRGSGPLTQRFHGFHSQFVFRTPFHPVWTGGKAIGRHKSRVCCCCSSTTSCRLALGNAACIPHALPNQGPIDPSSAARCIIDQGAPSSGRGSTSEAGTVLNDVSLCRFLK